MPDGAAHSAATSLPRTDAAGKPIKAVETFAELAAEATAGSSYPLPAGAPARRLAARALRYDPTSLPGHAYRNLEFFLTTGKHGTSEQFAASFGGAGADAGSTDAGRGRLPAADGAGARGAGGNGSSAQITGRDALAWPEVRFEGVGWVPFYPTPGQAAKEGRFVRPSGRAAREA